MNTSDRNYAEDGSNEVEDLLRQAEDSALLQLTVNGHMAHHSSSDLPPDLAHRFQTLKFGPSTRNSIPKPTKASTVGVELTGDKPSSLIDNDDPDDLLARFTALKASLPTPSSAAAASSSTVKEEGYSNENRADEVDKIMSTVRDDSNENREDEVDKIMRWAIDAARLDPSPESDNDEDDINASDRELDTSEEEDDDEDDYDNIKKKK